MNQTPDHSKTNTQYDGSCLCGEIRYTVTGVINDPTMCHCHMCQKQHGAPFGVYSDVSKTDFRWTSGETSLSRFKSSKTVTRTFCQHCGSTLQFVRDGRSSFGLAIATLDTPFDLTPKLQICTSSCAPWWTLQDTPQSHAEYP